jgi:RNA polymerase sigma-B factor
VHEFAVAEREATERLVVQQGRQPTAPELAAAMGLDLDEVLEAQDALHARDTRSFDSADTDGWLLGDHIGADDERFAAAEDHVALAEAMKILDPPARELLHLYFFEERSQSEIAALLGVSQMQVSRLLSAVLRRLRNRVGPR